MAKRPFDLILEKARHLLQERGEISTAFLMRKLKIDYQEALKAFNALGFKTREQQIEEWAFAARNESNIVKLNV